MAYEKQHYLPQFYLRGFTASEKQGHVWAYRDDRPNWELRGISVTGQERFYYSFIDETGRRNHSVEQQLQKIEDDIAPAVRKLNATSEALTADERMAIARMIAFWMCRVPAYHEWAATDVEALTQKIIAQSYESFQNDNNMFEQVKKVYQQTTGRTLTLEQTAPEQNKMPLPKSTIKQTALATAEQLAGVLNEMNWTVYHAQGDDTFITSDSPVFTNNGITRRAPVYGGLLQEGIEVTLPLTHSALIYASWADKPVSDIMHRDAVRDEIVNLNIRTGRRAKYLLVSSKRDFPGIEQVETAFLKFVSMNV